MKLVLTPVEQAEAINNWITYNYGIPLKVSSDTLKEITIDTKPLLASEAYKELKESGIEQAILAEDARVEREWAIERADELGIKYRADISTDKLVERIEEYELDMIINPYAVAGVPTEAPKEVELDSEDDLEQQVPEVQEPMLPKTSIFNRGK